MISRYLRMTVSLIQVAFILMFRWNFSTMGWVDALCHRHEIVGSLDVPGHLPMPIRYSVCIDNTTIAPRPSSKQTGVAVFSRECCGCRVSSVTEREVKMQTLSVPSVTRTFFIPEIHACQCIPCDAKVYNWANYFLVMSHLRRK